MTDSKQRYAVCIKVPNFYWVEVTATSSEAAENKVRHNLDTIAFNEMGSDWEQMEIVVKQLPETPPAPSPKTNSD